MRTLQRYFLVAFAVFLAVAPASAFRGKEASSFSLPVVFESNIGQIGTDYQFQARTQSYSALIRANEVRFIRANRSPLSISFVGVDGKAKARMGEQAKFKTNYFLSGHQKWTSIPNYFSVGFAGVYGGINLDYHSATGALEFDFTLEPMTDVSTIWWTVEGAKEVRNGSDGSLVLQWDGTVLELKRPVAYQQTQSGKKEVEVGYDRRADGSIGFRVGEYNHSLPLVIDPVVLDSSVALGSISVGNSIAVGRDGSIYLAGDTNGGVTPTTALNSVGNGAYVVKFAADGSTPVYASVFADIGIKSISADSVGNIYFSGIGFKKAITNSQANYFNCGEYDYQEAILGKLDPSGSQFLFSACIGTPNLFKMRPTAQGVSVAANDAGEAWLLGKANYDPYPLSGSSSNVIPTTPGAYQAAVTCTPTGSGDSCEKTFVAKFDTTKTGAESLVYSTLIAGTYNHDPQGIAVDATGNAYIVGATNSPDYPVLNGFRNTCDGCYNIFNVFVTKLNAAGTALGYSTFIGRGYGQAIALDANSNAYITGGTSADNYPVLNGLEGFQNRTAGFLTKVTAAGDALAFSTYLNEFDQATAISLDSDGTIYVGGGTANHSAPLIQPAFGYPGTGNDYSAYGSAMRLKPDASSVVWSTFVPKKGYVQGIQVSPSHEVFVAGGSSYESYSGGTGQDAWLIGMHLNATTSNPVPQVVTISPSRILAGDPTYTSSLPLVVDGSDFVYGATVNWNGSAVSTQFISSTRLVGSIPRSQFASAGTATITVTNPAPGGGVSNSATVTIYPPNAVPTITSLTPNEVMPGSAGFTLTLSGTGFVDSSIVRWNLADRPTTFVNATTLTAAIPASDLVTRGTAQVQVFNPTPGGGLSAAVSFAITDDPDFTIAAQSSTATVSAGGTAKYALSLSPVRGFTGNVTFSCSGLPDKATCTFSPASLALASGGTVDVSIATSAATMASAMQRAQTVFLASLVFPLGGVVIVGYRRRSRLLLSAVVLVAIGLATLLVGCGGGGSPSKVNPQQPIPGTPVGSYNVTITASSGTVQHAFVVKLNVQ